MKYYAITETIEIPIHQEPKEYSKEDIEEALKKFNTGDIFSPIDPNPPIKPFMVIPMSEETFKFISSVANTYSTSFGEKEYEINKVRFKIFTEKEYELRYGKYDNYIP